MRFLIIVVLYNKEIEDSETLQCISKIKNINGNLIIVNNGPKELELQDDDSFGSNLSIDLFNFIYNKPLSYLYNELVASHPGYDFYCIFDDDTLISPDFFSVVENNESYDFFIPKVFSRNDGELYYPLINDKVSNINKNKIFTQRNFVSTIASGIILNKTLVEKFKYKNESLFDERFALYGVDVSLFKKILKLYDEQNTFSFLIEGSIYHGLSRVTTGYSYFRERERMYDSVLSKILYKKNNFDSLAFIFKKIIKFTITFKFGLLFELVKVMVYREHPRCKEYKGRITCKK